MTAGTQAVKATAKTALKNNWVKAIAAVLTLLFALLLSNTISYFVHVVSSETAAYVFIAVVGVFLVLPVSLGMLRFFWRMIHGMDDNPIVCFYYFSEKRLYLRAIKLIFSIILRTLGFGFLIFLPFIAVEVLSSAYIFDILDMPTPMWTANLEAISVFLKTLSTVLLFFTMLRYYSAPVLTVADDDMDIEEAIHMSVTVSKGSLLDFIYLFFSFLGWILISAFYVPIIFTLPYMLTAYVVHVRFAIADYNKHIKTLENEDYSSYSAGI